MSRKVVKTRSKNKLGYIDPSVAGIDIGSKLIHVSIPDNTGGTTVVEYGSDTPQLHLIAKNLKAAGVITAVMEATGVYWIPLFEILESKEYGIKPVLVDAKSVKNVPGRKTDVLDSQWIQTLYSSGLLRAAFRPPKDRVTLREYTRVRRGITKTRQRALLQMEKALQLMNIKLSSALSDIAGMSGQKIIRAIVAGHRDPKYLALLRDDRCHKSTEDFIAALTGNYQKENIFALEMALEQYDYSHEQLKKCDMHILEELEKLPDIKTEPLPPRDKDKKSNGKYDSRRKSDKNAYTFDVSLVLWRKSGVDLGSLPGISDQSALTIFAELGGTNVDAWKSEKEFASWLKLCPGNNVSGGKSRKSKRQPCVNPVSQILRLSAVSCKHSKSSIGAFIRRICGRTDKPKGIKAGAHKLAIMVYQICKYGMSYVEKGEMHANKKYEEQLLKNMQKRAKQLGYELVAIA